MFGDFDPDEHAAEAEARWGDTDAYRESARRTAAYSKADWDRIKAEGMAVDAAEAHRRQIDGAFYPCSYEMHTGLAAMYLADPRFTATHEAVAPGMARYVHDAILANAARHGD